MGSMGWVLSEIDKLDLHRQVCIRAVPQLMMGVWGAATVSDYDFSNILSVPYLIAVFSSSTPATLIELILNIAQIPMGLSSL